MIININNKQQDYGSGNRIFEKAISGLVFESFSDAIHGMCTCSESDCVASDAVHCGNVVFRPMYCKILFDVPLKP